MVVNMITMRLLMDNILTLHCGSFSDRKTKMGYLVFGASNTGKSHTVFEALKKGYQYHSEDLAIMDVKHIYTMPHISSLSDKLPQKDIFLSTIT